MAAVLSDTLTRRRRPAAVWPRLFTVLAAAIVTGCGRLALHDSTPDFRDGAVTRPWRIHCETALTYDDSAGDTSGGTTEPMPHGRSWIWARDDGGRAYVIDGVIEDGYVLARNVRVEGSDASTADVPATAAGVRAACARTLARLHPTVARELGKVRGAREGEEINAPLLFPNDPTLPRATRRMVVFGDSLSDTGRLRQRLYAFPRSPYWMGRFSNGPVWPDWFEAQTGIAIQNHAYGGASATRHAMADSEPLLVAIRAGGQFFVTGSIEVQVQDYLARNLLGRPLAAPDETVFLLWAGANDYIWKEPFSGAIGTFLNRPKSAEGYEHVVEETIAGLGHAVTTLHSAGARRFVLVNLPDLGRTPIVLQNRTFFPEPPASDEAARKLELAKRLSDVTRFHNRRLAEEAGALRERLDGAQILLVDSEDALDRLLDGRAPAPAAGRFDYGYEIRGYIEELGHGDRALRIPRRCFRGGYTGTSDRRLECERASRSLFWDVLHPSSLTHCWQAHAIQSAMAHVGWCAPPPPAAEQRARCEGVVDRDRERAIDLGLGSTWEARSGRAEVPPSDGRRSQASR